MIKEINKTNLMFFPFTREFCMNHFNNVDGIMENLPKIIYNF